ncbi:MAG: thermonuclease family protein [Clostridia bacterium]|nr:thermonuclease family protein [Clostridia bacterium]
MNKRSLSILSILLLLCMLVGCFTACKSGEQAAEESKHVDYVEQVKFDESSETLKQEVTVKMFIDGDTTHFDVPTSFDPTGVVKARFLAVNTPESTGKIEEWGKTASNFTKEKLSTATSIIIESDDNSWNFDGNGRYLVWIWYKTADSDEYRNLNIEILQSGLGVGSSASDNRYGEIAVAAIAQAKEEKLYVFSGEKDPTFPYGEAQEVTLRELRTNISDYAGAKVVFEGIITHNSDWTAFVEEYDPETEMYYGFQIFYGYTSALTNVLAQGNRVRVTGTVTEFNGTYQVSGLGYKPMRPDDPENTVKINEGNTPAFTETTAEKFLSDISLLIGDEQKTFKYQELAVSTSISMKNLVVKSVYTTTSEGSSDKGAMTLTCEVDGKTIDVRTAVLKDSNGNLITEEYFQGKTIDVKGIVEYFDYNNTGNGKYQINIYTLNDAIIH